MSKQLLRRFSKCEVGFIFVDFASPQTLKTIVTASRFLHVYTPSAQPFCCNVGGRLKIWLYAASFFVKPGTEIDDDYYRDELLMELLAAIRSMFHVNSP